MAPDAAVKLGFAVLGIGGGFILRSFTELGVALSLVLVAALIVEFTVLVYVNWHLDHDAQDAAVLNEHVGDTEKRLAEAVERIRTELALALSVRFQRISDLNDDANNAGEDYLTQLMRNAKKSVWIVDLISDGKHVNDVRLKKELRQAYYDTLIRKADTNPDFEYTRICQFPDAVMTFASLADDVFVDHCRQMQKRKNHKFSLKRTTRVLYPTTFGIVDGESIYLDLAPSPDATDAHLRGELIIEDHKQEIIKPFWDAFYALSHNVASAVDDMYLNRIVGA